jgi:hypothetical protein
VGIGGSGVTPVKSVFRQVYLPFDENGFARRPGLSLFETDAKEGHRTGQSTGRIIGLSGEKS